MNTISMNTFTWALTGIVVVFVMLAVIQLVANRYLRQIVKSHQKWIKLLETKNRKTKIKLQQECAINAFLMQYCVDLTEASDDDALMKIRGLSSAIQIMMIQDDRERLKFITSNFAYRRKTRTQYEKLQAVVQAGALHMCEKDTRSAYDRFVEAVNKLNEDLYVAEMEHDQAKNALRGDPVVKELKTSSEPPTATVTVEDKHEPAPAPADNVTVIEPKPEQQPLTDGRWQKIKERKEM